MSDRVPGQLFDALVGHRDRRLVFRLLAWRCRSVRVDLIAVLLAAGLAAACGDDPRGVSPTGPTESGGIVVESTALNSVEKCDVGGCFDRCDIVGTVRNDTTTNRKVTLTFTAFDKNGNDISTDSGVLCLIAVCGPAMAKNEKGGDLVVPAGGRSTYGALLFGSGDCDKVARLEITELKSEPVA